MKAERTRRSQEVIDRRTIGSWLATTIVGLKMLSTLPPQTLFYEAVANSAEASHSQAQRWAYTHQAHNLRGSAQIRMRHA
jgi:hypothetical protein